MPRRAISIPAELPSPETIDIKKLADGLAAGFNNAETAGDCEPLDLVTVLGPTASGKTKYAVALARKLGKYNLNCEIISADSRQIYRGMDIGTGKDLDEYGEIPCHLIDILPAGAQYNVYEFRRDFQTTYDDIRGRGAVPILCGGTGLYLNAVVSGYDFSSKTPLSEKRASTPAEGHPRNPFIIGTLVSRETRNERIDARLDARLKEGMIDEIKGLLDAGVPAETLISYGLEYKFVTLYLQGKLSYEEMRLQLATAIHQFAKRQMTWFRGMERSGVTIHWTEV